MTSYPAPQLDFFTGTANAYTFDDADSSLLAYTIHAALKTEGGWLAVRLTEGAGISKTAGSFTVHFTASQCQKVAGQAKLAIDFYQGDVLATQALIPLNVQPLFIPQP